MEIRDVEKGGMRALTTDDHGRYREPLLPPGEYELRMTVAGFQPGGLKGIQLTVGQDAVLDVKLQLRGGTERVDVTANAAPPSTRDPQRIAEGGDNTHSVHLRSSGE